MASYRHLYVHCVWGTWDRLPLITPVIAPPLYAGLMAKCRALGCVPMVIGGMPDHVHMLIEFSATITIARLIGEIKGASSHLMTHAIAPSTPFKWQGSYGAFTLSKRSVPQIQRYIENQKHHHADGTTLFDLETMTDE